MEERKQFTFYISFERSIRALPEPMRQGMYEAIVGYALFQKEPQGLNEYQQSVFEMCRPNLDTARRRAASGKIGGSISERKKISKGEKEKEGEKENEKEIELESKDDYLCAEGFEKFWDQYPVKIGKEQAFDAWCVLEEDADTVIKGLARWNTSIQWNRQGRRFIPRAAKFLAEQHFLESPEQEIPKGASGELGQAEVEAIEKVMCAEM